MINTLRFIAIAACLATNIGISTQVSAVQTQPGNTSDKVQEAAGNAARLVGAARYCKVDDDLIEEFITNAEAYITTLAKDDYEKVFGRLEFKNIYAASRVKEPPEGCKKAEKDFADTMRSFR